MPTPRVVFIALFLFCFILLVGRIVHTKSAFGGDAVYYYALVRSLVIDGDLDFSNEYQYFHSQVSPYTGNRKIPRIPPRDQLTGRLPNKYPLGTVLLLAPFFGFGHLISLFLGAIGFTVESDGYNLIYQAASGFGSMVYGFWGILVIFRFGKEVSNARFALMGATAVLLATPLIYYMTMEPLMSHSVSMFAVTMFIVYWYRTEASRKPYQWCVLGLMGGLMSITRYQDALFLLIPLGETLVRSCSRKLDRKRCRPMRMANISAYLLAAGAVMGLQSLVNLYLNGSLFSSGYAEDTLCF